MANTINTQTGLVGGIATIGDNSGALNIQTLATNAILIDTSQNVTIPKLAVTTSLNVTGSATFSGGVSGVGGISNMQVFTSSGTFTVPAGITKVKVTVVGGGGGASFGVGGTSGNTSSFGAYCSATGGAPGSGAGGTGSGGTINFSGQAGAAIVINGISCSASWGVQGGVSLFGGSYGSGAYASGGTVGGGGGGYAGSGGGAAIEIISGLTPGGTVSVTVGAGGLPPNCTGLSSGNPGVVIVEY